MTEKPEKKPQDTPVAGCNGGPGTGPDNPEAREQGLSPRRSLTAHPVERVTALRGLAIARPRAPKSAVRRQTLMDISGIDPEIPYVKFETAARNLVCSLMERQDRMNEEIFYQISDLRYRVEDLEADRQGSGGAS